MLDVRPEILLDAFVAGADEAGAGDERHAGRKEKRKTNKVAGIVDMAAKHHVIPRLDRGIYEFVNVDPRFRGDDR